MTLINTGHRTHVPKGKTTELLDQFPRPKNCQNINMPRVNQEIWAKLPKERKSVDVKLQFLQTILGKVVSPLAYLMESLITGSKDKQACLKMAGDSLHLLFLAFTHISSTRRGQLVSDLRPVFRPLAAPSNPVTELLFGDDVSKKMKELQDAQ